MSKHTALPWMTKPEEPGTNYIRIRGTALGSRYKIANVLTLDESYPLDMYELEHEETRANAEFIVRACNAHDELTAQRDDLLEHSRYILRCLEGDVTITQADMAPLRAAIARAEDAG